MPRSRAASTVLVAAVLLAAPARAADYPWCYVDQTMSGATYCAFATFAQCRANAGGNGGFCVQNPGYRPPSSADARRGVRR
jgi:hypothetical protein